MKPCTHVYLKLAGEVYGGNSAYALPIEDDVLGGHAHPRPQGVPGRLYIRVQVLLAWFT